MQQIDLDRLIGCRLRAAGSARSAALEQLATPPVPTYGEPLGIEVDIDGHAVVIVLSLGLSYSADLHKPIRPTRSARRGGQSYALRTVAQHFGPGVVLDNHGSGTTIWPSRSGLLS